MGKLLHGLGNPDYLWINLDTGNSWLRGAEPVELANKLASKIKHVHFSELSHELESERGTRFGCGMSSIALVTGAIDIKGILETLVANGFTVHTTLELAVDEAILASYNYLKELGAE